MNLKQLARKMKNYTGADFITRADLARFLGIKDPHCVDKYLAGLQRIGNKYYFIPDVAEALMGREER